jgi:hypothetical protein
VDVADASGSLDGHKILLLRQGCDDSARQRGNGKQLAESCGVKSWLYQPEEEHNIQDKIALPENTDSGAELG